ncbi:Alpha/Beta hydrolase protein [Mycena sp. CBHHK59/15]|nr:Alpha/Beta hydrolase protein [Mycena sp. CBHHK59/15]
MPPLSAFLRIAAACFFVSSLRSHLGLPSLVLNAVAASDFEWETLTPSDQLNWTACYSGFQCSRLQVPLDYDDSSKGNATIAIVRLPSNSSKSEYRGPILFNPGGPGGSGVSAIVAVGTSFAEFLGGEFDIVGFDPRGVAYSTPTIEFFKTDLEKDLWIPEDLNIRYPSLNTSVNSQAISEQWAKMQLIGQLGQQRDVDQNFQHMTTDNTARDMLRITEAFGYDKLQYWGVSYGTVLGATFATLFPDKVERMVIDGVMDWEAWYSANMTISMEDTNKALQTFFDGCAAAGPDDCAFYAPSADEIAANLDSLINSIRAQPFPVLTEISHGTVDFSFLRNYIFASLYSPYNSFQSFAQGLADLAVGNATSVYTANQVAEAECECNNTASTLHANTYEAMITIACGDGSPVTDSPAELEAFYLNEAKLSSFADIFTHWRIYCSGWKVHREGRFQGPIGANTSFPLLLIGNTADTVTPFSSAVKTSGLFPGSVVLTQDSPGHTSLVAPSLCTHGYLRQYFKNGTLPAAGTVCAVDAELFPSTSTTSATKRAISIEDRKLLDAVRKIGDVVLPIATRKLGDYLQRRSLF